MKKKDIEKTIYKQFNERKPELFEKIKAQLPEMNEEPKESVFDKLRSIFLTRKFSYSFASLALIILFVFVLINQGNTVIPQAYSLVAIDVNPSLVLELDEEDKVINIVINNEDADVIIGDMDLIGVDYNVAINALIGSMVTNGYISDLTNSVLLSISSENKNHETDLLAELTQKVTDLLTANNIEGSIIIQELEVDIEEEELAELLGISEAKAELITDIVELDPRMVIEELAQLSINELNLLLESKNYVIAGLDKTGKASTLGLITPQEAYQAALTIIGVNESTVIEYEVELEQEDGIIVYQVEIETELEEYDILINAENATQVIDEDVDEEDFPTNTLTVTQIKSLISSELGINIGTVEEFELSEEVDNGVAYYDVSFTYNDIDYELEIDAVTGEIYTNSMDDEGYDFDNESDSDDPEEEEESEEEPETEVDED